MTSPRNAGKAPSVQFYYKDFLAKMQAHPPEIVGAWTLVLVNIWHAKSNGHVTHTLSQWSRVMNTTEQTGRKYLDYFQAEGIGDVSEHDGKITVVSRRVQRDSKLLEQNRLRQETFRGKGGSNGDVTEKQRDINAVVIAKKGNPSSSTSSSSSLTGTLKFKKSAILKLLKKDHGTCFRWFQSEFEAPTKRDLNTLEKYAKLCAVLMDDYGFNTWLSETVADIARKPVGYPGTNRMLVKAINNKIEKMPMPQGAQV